MTLSLAAVFIPVFFMGGILGRLLHEFAVTIVAAILMSGLVSLTLTPMLCSRFLRPPREERHGRLYALTERFFQGMLAFYDRTLQWVLRHRRGTMIASGLLLLLTLALLWAMPMGFLPTEDQGSIFAFTEAAEGISFDAMMRQQKQVAAIVGQKSLCGQLFLRHRGGRPQRGRQYRTYLYPPDSPQPAAAGGEDHPATAAPSWPPSRESGSTPRFCPPFASAAC